MRNVCRPFILYNDFLPPTKIVHKDWQYLSFGYYDGVSVGNNLLKQDECNLGALWEFYVRHGKALDGSFSSQIIFGFRCEDDCSEAGDAVFWESADKNKYPFLFISLIQIDKSKSNLRSGWNKHKELEQKLNDHNKRRVITYLTLDNSDLILVLRCKNYSDGAGIIELFHCGTDKTFSSIMDCNLSYSFTIAAIEKKFLNDANAIAALNETISEVYVYMIEREPGSITDIRKKLSEKLKEEHMEDGKSLLGCNDELVILKNLQWSDFLELFQDITGILNHSNKEYQKKLIGVTTIIGHEQCPRIAVQRTEIDNTSERQLLTDKMRRICDRMSILYDGESACLQSIKHDIYQMINSLHKFETTPFPDYLFQTAILPLNMVLDMAEETIHQSQIYDFYESYYTFMKGFNLYVQNFSRSDRQFTQTPDFNFKIYDTPVRLNAFYNAFIFHLKQYLNDLEDETEEKHKYEFLACPGVTNNMQVLELFKKISKIKRLFLVEIPESQVYNPKGMLIMLSHEVAHFVGKKIRNREDRFSCAKEIAGQIIVKYMKFGVEEYCGYMSAEFQHIQNEAYWKKIKETIVSLLDEYMSDKNYDAFLKEKCCVTSSDGDGTQLIEMMRERKNHSEVLRVFLAESIANILEDYEDELWGYILEQDFLFWLNNDARSAYEKRERLAVKIQDIIRKFMGYYEWNKNAFSVMTSINQMIDIFKECIADLVGILTLELPMKDYLETILQSAKDQGFGQNFTNTAIIIRGGLVTYCMQYISDEEDLGYIWNEKDLQMIEQEDNEVMRNLMVDILNFLEDYMGEGEKLAVKNRKITNAMDMLLDEEILELMAVYLLRSKRSFAMYNSDEKKVMQKELIRIYQLFGPGDITELALEMQEYIEKYQKEIQVNNQKYAQESE